MENSNYPAISIGGRDYLLKITLGGLRRLEELGIDPGAAMRPATRENPYTTAEVNDLYRRVAGQVVAFAHEDQSGYGDLKPAGLSLDWAEDTIEPYQIPGIMESIAQAVLFRQPTGENPALPAAQETTKAELPAG